MRIVFAHYLSAPFLAAALGILYFAWEHDGQGALWMVPFIVAAAFIWVLTPQINWWWYSKHPPELEDGVKQALAQWTPFYQALPEAERLRFRQRLALTRMATNWTSKQMPDDEIPPDLQVAVAVQAVIATWHRDKYLLPEVENVVISPDVFFSPQYPYPHFCETWLPEQCILLGARPVMDAFAQPHLYFNIALYEYLQRVPEHPLFRRAGMMPEEALWQQIKDLSGWDHAYITEATGLKEVSAVAVWACVQLTFAPAKNIASPL